MYYQVFLAQQRALDDKRLAALPDAEFHREVALRTMRAQEAIARQGPPIVNVRTSIF